MIDEIDIDDIHADLVANAVGAHPSIRIYPTPRNVEATRRMFALRRRLHWMGFAAAVLLLALAYQLGTAGTAGRAGS